MIGEGKRGEKGFKLTTNCSRINAQFMHTNSATSASWLTIGMCKLQNPNFNNNNTEPKLSPSMLPHNCTTATNPPPY